ncbi:MAG: indolepyruvate ferredoxin oxidoreductase subunit alpha [Candidatus Diapherotrites archaeon]|nr:indolepyruvate ferredoxin oxidoreductase subunit alpha [Candidatus Diapherotrites archaeon]
MSVLAPANSKTVLLGNEAITRGALEAGVGVVACYPGTPSSEVPATFSRIAKETGVYFEYSSNEKVAFETAAGAAWSGVRAMTAMKHFGLNVAADSVGPVAYVGVKAGLVVMVSDDPNGWSSAQSEQDTRYYARMFRMPMFEPANPQEGLDYTKKIFDISEEFEIPVFLRTTTKVSHSIGTVKVGRYKKPNRKGKFKKDMQRYYNLRPNLQKMHRAIDAKLEAIQKKYSKNFTTEIKGSGKTAIICSGVSYEYAREATVLLGLKAPILKLGMTHPMPDKELSAFIKNKDEVLVLEELQPIIEEHVTQLAKAANPKLVVHGKDLLPKEGEYNLEKVLPAVAKIFKKKCPDFAARTKKEQDAVKGLPPRKPVFCAGCPHRSTFYAVNKVFPKDTVWAGDIGCYVLGIFEPFEMQDFIVSMGASLGIGHGISCVSDQEVVAFIGDSTFFHASLPGLANMAFNNCKSPLVIVMDNSVTAMTGHQPHPASGFTGMGDPVKKLSIEDICKELGAEVRVANAFSQKDLVSKLEELKKLKGLRVLVSRGECRLFTKRKLRKQGVDFPVFEIDQEKCKKCGVCTDQFACPAIVEIHEKKGDKPTYWINPDHCWGCSVCMQICPYGAIRAGVRKK